MSGGDQGKRGPWVVKVIVRPQSDLDTSVEKAHVDKVLKDKLYVYIRNPF